MAEQMTTIGDIRVLRCAADGPPLRGAAETVDVVGEATWGGADLVVVPVARLDPGFFTLSSGIAGEIAQKFVNYRLRWAVEGDIGEHLAASSALRAFVTETNRGRQMWFVADPAELAARLAAAA